MDSGAQAEQIPVFVGVPGDAGAGRADYIVSGQMAFAAWSDDYATTLSIPTDTYRIWTSLFSSNLGSLALFDIPPPAAPVSAF